MSTQKSTDLTPVWEALRQVSHDFDGAPDQETLAVLREELLRRGWALVPCVVHDRFPGGCRQVNVRDVIAAHIDRALAESILDDVPNVGGEIRNAKR